MLSHLRFIMEFIVNAFLHSWPYLLVTIPLAVAVQMSGAARYIERVFRARPLVAILLATVVGAFSPFCSCSVIPVVTALLISGVPLAPVMSFWIASPSMDPEAFFLSVTTIGWELAVWRMSATLGLSLAAGYTTHFLIQREWLGKELLRTNPASAGRTQLPRQTVTQLSEGKMLLIRQRVANWVSRLRPVAQSQLATEAICCAAGAAEDSWQPVLIPIPTTTSPEPKTCKAGCETASLTFGQRLWGETQKAILMVVKFMALAYLLEALIMLYIPEQWITSLLGNDNPGAIIIAAVLGVPVFTSNLAALPMIGGLLSQGMNPAAALAFLISGPTTTLPAMAAVWGIASRRVFALYVSFSLLGAVVAGYLFNWVVGA